MEAKDFVNTQAHEIAPAEGKLGVLLVGLGAVASTFLAGVEHMRRGAKPFGSLTQGATIRLGKRTDENVPLIKDFVPLAELNDLVFGAWDPIPDNAYEAAVRCGVLDRYEHIEPIADFLKSIEPMPAAFDNRYAKAIHGTNVKQGASKMDLAEQIRQDIRDFKAKNNCSRLVMVWAASTEIFIEEHPEHLNLEDFEAALETSNEWIAPSMLYAYAAMMEGVPFANGAPNLTVDIPALVKLANDRGVPICGKDFKTGQTLLKTVLAPMFKARMLGLNGWFSTNILGNRDGEVLDDPENFKTKEESKLGVLEHILQPDLYPDLYGDLITRCASTTTRRAATTKRAGTTSTSSGGWATRCRSRSTSCAATRSSPRRSCWTWRCSWTWRSAPASRASRSGSRSTSRARSTPRTCTRSTTSSSSRRS